MWWWRHATRKRDPAAMVCGCCADKRKGELFKPHRDRGCTDVVCLLLLIVAVGGLAAISYVAISAHPSLVDDSSPICMLAVRVRTPCARRRRTATARGVPALRKRRSIPCFRLLATVYILKKIL